MEIAFLILEDQDGDALWLEATTIEYFVRDDLWTKIRTKSGGTVWVTDQLSDIVERLSKVTEHLA